ncbi:MAG: M20/M25/M40 family metallo-hydrolase [Lachnospiraceae bacterium]|nr:M20/M25/M40 family metallo-hydrolase [Lachnospiraceae bacterium]
MDVQWQDKIRNYIESHAPEAERLLKDLAVIPAPSEKEERRASFCRKWLEAHGAEGVYIDAAGNVIYPYEARHRSRLSVYMAHLDVVFPDEDKLVIRQKGNVLTGPGVGDDTANLVNLLMAAAFFASEKPKLQTGILFVADTGEEGLGNLKGCRQLVKDYGSRIAQMVSFDLYLGQCFTQCVGSLRYEVTVQTEGGHSFSAFGNASAVHQISQVVCALYEKEVPKRAQTTYNVGVIEGGTSVNTIAQEARILYEIRSVDAGCMEEMREFFQETIERFAKTGMQIFVKQVGERPCAGAVKAVEAGVQERLIDAAASVIKQTTGKAAEKGAASTDANIPLSMGIPALTLGTIVGGKAHTREEWVDLDSQRIGMKLALGLIFALSETDFFFLTEPEYRNGMVIQGNCLLEVLNKQQKRLKLPTYIYELAPLALEDVHEIHIKAWDIGQVKSWLPILRAQRAVLEILQLKRDENQTDQELPAHVWLPFSHTGGFEAVFANDREDDRENEREDGRENGRKSRRKIDFQAYDSRFVRIQDQELRLEMAVSRLLYPAELEKKARSQYEDLLKKRFRPALTRLVSGKWNQYGQVPKRAGELFRLRKMDHFLRKDLLKQAADSGQTGFVRLLDELEDVQKTESEDAQKAESGDKRNVGLRNILKAKQREALAGFETPQQLQNNVWNPAIQELCIRRPGLERLCGILSPCEKKEGMTVLIPGTDGSRIYDTQSAWKYFVSHGVRGISRLYAHMLFHCLYQHPFFIPNALKSRKDIWNLACDIAVEYLVDEIFGPKRNEKDGSGVFSLQGDENLAWKRQEIYDLLQKEETELTAERIAVWLLKSERQKCECVQKKMEDQIKTERKKSFIDCLQSWFFCDNHDFWNWESACGSGADSESWKENPKSRQDLLRQLREKWSAAGEGFKQASANQMGKYSLKPGNREMSAKLTKRQGYDYHDFLKQFMVMREDRLLDLDNFDTIYYTYGLAHYKDMPLIEPLETKEVLRLLELVIVIDTSGSCSGELVRFFLEETWSVFGQTENFFDRFHVRLLQCDTCVQEDVKLTNLQEAEDYMKNLVIRGGGGTDFREAFSYIRKLQKQGELMYLKGILYFTDGFGTFPENPPFCKTTFIFLESRFGQVEVPYWADKLLLKLPEDADWEPEYTGGFRANIRKERNPNEQGN